MKRTAGKWALAAMLACGAGPVAAAAPPAAPLQETGPISTARPEPQRPPVEAPPPPPPRPRGVPLPPLIRFAPARPTPSTLAETPPSSQARPAEAPLPPLIRATPARPDPVAPARPARAAARAAPAVPRPPARAAAAETGAGARVQIGAFRSEALARAALANLAAAFPVDVGGRPTQVVAAQVKGETFYRGLVGGFPSRAAATTFCSALQSRNRACFVRG